jgi:serine/threonine protein kinase
MSRRRSSPDGLPVLEPGSLVAPGYVVREHLSRGRALDVYEAWSADRDCPCVVKTLRPDRAADRLARRRLKLEGELLLQLSHPHIVRAYELRLRPQPAVVLETLGGATLAYLIQTRKRGFPAAELAVLGLQLASAVAYIHRHGYLHLDLKPSNVVCETGLAKLIDLSVAHAPGNGRKAVGSRPYMAPEQARAGKRTVRTDVWGIGTVLYEAATGRRTFDRTSVRTFRRLPAELGAAIDACLELDPGDRPTVAALSSVLVKYA